MNRTLKKILVPVIAVLAGFILGALVMLAARYNPIYGYEDMFGSALGSSRAIGETIQTTGPLILEALGFAVAMKAGLFNIGMSGQALAGWFMSIWFALSFPDMPRLLMIPAVIIVGAVVGAIVGFIPGVLRAFFGTSEVIVTIMMNYVILYLSTFMLHSVFSRKIIDPQSSDQTLSVHANATFAEHWMSTLTNNSTMNIGIFIALIALVIMAILMSRTTLGFEITAVGLNPDASEYAGISSKATIINSMLVAGVLAGLGGVVYGIGYMGNFVLQSSTFSIGFNGMAVALLGENNPIGIFFAAILFSILQTGGPGMGMDGIPSQIADVVTAAIIFFIAVKFIIERALPAARAKKEREEVAK